MLGHGDVDRCALRALCSRELIGRDEDGLSVCLGDLAVSVFSKAYDWSGYLSVALSERSST